MFSIWRRKSGSDEAMRAAYKREAPYRPHWPNTYEAAITDPLIAAVLETMARHGPSYGRRANPANDHGAGRFADTVQTFDSAPAPLSVHRPAPNVRRFLRTPFGTEIDIKSRAAGEKPDED